MELWQALLIMVLGVDVIIQFCRWQEEVKQKSILRRFIQGMEDPECASERPAAIMEMKRDLQWIKDALNGTYNLVSNEANKVIQALTPRRKR